MDDCSSLETSDLLQAAVQRAANIRNELVQLRVGAGPTAVLLLFSL